MKQPENFDWEALKKKALEQFKSGESLYGKDGAFAPMLKQFLEAALEEELKSHLKAENADTVSNRKNGKQTNLFATKKLLTLIKSCKCVWLLWVA